MMRMEGANDAPARILTQERELLECLRRLGKGLIASGSSVGVVENTLTEIAQAYEMDCEIVALPNILMIKVGQATQELADFTVQRPTTMQLNQISAPAELVDQVQQKQSVTSILSRDYQSAFIGLGEMLVLIISIALGILLGTLIVSPHKFVPVSACAGRLDAGKA